jgi:lysyl-tRNA synthetase class 2
MKPEGRMEGTAKGHSEVKGDLTTNNGTLELSDDEKLLLSILKNNSPIDLNELKVQTGLSNKKWDKAIKGLTKNKLARVEKTDAGLFVSLV